jgi:hypothetical protein
MCVYYHYTLVLHFEVSFAIDNYRGSDETVSQVLYCLILTKVSQDCQQFQDNLVSQLYLVNQLSM